MDNKFVSDLQRFKQANYDTYIIYLEYEIIATVYGIKFKINVP